MSSVIWLPSRLARDAMAVSIDANCRAERWRLQSVSVHLRPRAAGRPLGSVPTTLEFRSIGENPWNDGTKSCLPAKRRILLPTRLVADAARFARRQTGLVKALDVDGLLVKVAISLLVGTS